MSDLQPDHGAAATLTELVYQTVLGRPMNDVERAMRVAQLCDGLPFADFFVEVASSDEAAARRAEMSQPRPAEQASGPALAPVSHAALWRVIIVGTYERLLRRMPAEVEIEHWVSSLSEGLSVDEFLAAVNGAEEARIVHDATLIGPGRSDGEFLVTAGQLLHGRGLNPAEIVAFQGVLGEAPERRAAFVRDLLNDHIAARSSPDAAPALHDGTSCMIMGTNRMLTKALWNETRAMLRHASPDAPVVKRPPEPGAAFRHTGAYVVSMIASLYKGERFIRNFLENITTQSLFHSAELIIIDADSPDNEAEMIRDYERRFPNIVYKRVNYRIGIYEAWNVGVSLARGRYLTNTNVDDVRRVDSIEIQAAMLDAYQDVDVVYQDFYYSLDPNLTFAEIAAAGFRSALPVLTPHNLLMFNSPHNAPMWRARLHAEVGLFDTQYRSAGDYEFWARCLTAGKTFRKTNTPHVAYYRNPDGISTRPDTPGVREARDLTRTYGPRLTSPSLLQSRRDLAASLGLEAATEPGAARKSYFDLAQSALRQLGEGRRAERDNWTSGEHG